MKEANKEKKEWDNLSLNIFKSSVSVLEASYNNHLLEKIVINDPIVRHCHYS